MLPCYWANFENWLKYAAPVSYGLGVTRNVILAQDFVSWIRKYIENVRLGAYVGWTRVLSYAWAWDRSTLHKTDTPGRFGNVGGQSWTQALVSPRMSLNKFPRPYAIPKNIIIRSKHDASARHPKIHAIPYTESTVTAWTCPKVITKMVFSTFRLQILSAAYFAIFFFCTIYQNTIACE